MNLVRSLAIGLVLVVANVRSGLAAEWADIERAARGQTVSFNAWAGEDKINTYIAWVGAEVRRRYGVEIRHVKLSDTGEAVSRVVAEKSAGRDADGAVDLLWINGANFAAMKDKG